ncbi:MATE family efflux transporter [Caldicoprobacter algeriensis]|uniref:MATE family efflux transporter n=1 Tax=Caldicoprobacter algeriensis TaxID=699281 RepID=UPI00207A49A8|nr:MATE family efflux transporter [Caldicoprobacter algeriensis]MCM8901560.1 MATE family efflux transporter [Caldicoprobacter algeriensis]
MAKLADLFAPRDMTVGKPWKRIIEFSIPMLIGNVAQQLYNTVDSIVIGRYVGDNALAAVGTAFPVLNFLLVLFVAVATGAGIMVAQYFGAKDRERLSRSIGVCITLTAIASLIIMVVGPIVVRPMLVFINTPESILDWCANYLLILLVGNWGFSYFNILSGILRGLGDSLSALVFLLISTALNVVLDIWFVAGFNMGVPGVALATVIAQMISAILCLIKLKKMEKVFDLNWKVLKPLKEYATQLIRLGIPSGLTQAIFSVAMVAVQSLTNTFGEMVIACSVMVMRVDGFAMMPNFTFGVAMTTFAGQNVGAKKMDRVERGTLEGLIIAVSVSTVITITILTFGKYLMNIFTSTVELVDLSMRMMRILSVGYIAMAVTQVLSGVMRGAGDTVTPMWISLITTIALRVPIAYGIAYLTRSEAYPTGRPESVFISLLVAWVCGAIITTIFYKRGNWRKKALLGNEQIGV